MNRVWGLLKWVREKTNIKLVLVALVMLTGAFTAWQVYARFGGAKKLPAPNKITTGNGAPLPDAGMAMQVSAQAPVEVAGNDQSGATQPPPSQPPFAFNPNAFNNPPPAEGQPNYGVPAYGDQSEPAPSRPLPAPYQPVVAGDPSYADPSYAGPAYGGPSPPVNELADGTAPGGVPTNPIRSGGSLSDDPALEQPPLEQPPLEQPPLEQPPLEQSGPISGPPAPLTQLTPSAADYANRMDNAPPAPAPAPLESAPPLDAYPPPAEAPAPLNAGPLNTRPLNNYGSPAVADPQPLAAREATGLGTPGDRQFEGAQTPALTLEKIAPAEIQVGKLATFELRVKNVGQIAAQQVQVTDHIPKGTQLVDAQPQFQRAPDGTLVWSLGTMQPGDEQIVQLQVMPQQEGEIGSVAQVTFAASATARSVCTRPLLTVEHTAPQKLLIGETLNMTITVTNPGTGAATGVVVEEDVPPGLSHAAGVELEYEIGTLRPGETKRLELTLRAEKAGIIKNNIVVRGDANLAAEHEINIEVVAPQLQVGVAGPKRRFLERPATYTVSVSNPGTAAARDVELVAYLPRGMKFVESDGQGQYDPQQHAVFWSLEELPATKAGNVKLTAVPMEIGDQKLRIEGRADLGLNTAFEQVVSVDAAAELVHTIADLSDPIEVGSDTTYEIRIKNVGTKTATNVRIAALLPAELKALSGEGPTRAANDGSRVIFEPLARINPDEEAIFRVQANAQKAGDFIIRVQISSTEWPNPVTREESTRVYSDQ